MDGPPLSPPPFRGAGVGRVRTPVCPLPPPSPRRRPQVLGPGVARGPPDRSSPPAAPGARAGGGRGEWNPLPLSELRHVEKLVRRGEAPHVRHLLQRARDAAQVAEVPEEEPHARVGGPRRAVRRPPALAVVGGGRRRGPAARPAPPPPARAGVRRAPGRGVVAVVGPVPLDSSTLGAPAGRSAKDRADSALPRPESSWGGAPGGRSVGSAARGT